MSLKRSRLNPTEDLRVFYENFPEPPERKLEYFHPVQLPVVITEARVRMRSVQDYGVLSLLILRLFDAGITSEKAIQSISGMSEETVRTYVHKEKYVLEHIDPETDLLTQLGRLTLEENPPDSDVRPKSYQNYDSVIRVHIEPLTASLIPQYLEWEQGENPQPDQNDGDFLLPPEGAESDPDFNRELNTRLLEDINSRKEEHVSCDALKNGNTLDCITELKPIRVVYRWGYLAKFEGMQYPMILLSGRKTVENLNDRSKEKGNYKSRVLLPVTIAYSDLTGLQESGICFEGVIARRDACFEKLKDMVAEMAEHTVLTLPGEEPEEKSAEDVPTEQNEEEVSAEEPLTEQSEEEDGL